MAESGSDSGLGISTSTRRPKMHLALWITLLGLLHLEHSGTEAATIENYIVGGAPVDLMTLTPYQVSLQYKHNRHHFCGGSIISPYFILTAAHCLHNTMINSIRVMAGTNDQNNFGRGRQVRNARLASIHEAYDPQTLDNDIALILLDTPLHYTSTVRNITLPNRNEQFQGDTLVTGWGTMKVIRHGTTDNEGQTSTVLMSVQVVLRISLSRIFTFALEVRQGGTHGDSGGPAICFRPVQFSTSSTSVLCGVVSFGFGCGEARPGVYARVSSFIDWIENKRRALMANIGYSCKDSQFQCANGKCIRLGDRCDSYNDCGDGDISDEAGCDYKQVCRHDQVKCMNGKCINQKYRCDFDNDCGTGDYSDEERCRFTEQCNDDQHFKCFNGKCFETRRVKQEYRGLVCYLYGRET